MENFQLQISALLDVPMATVEFCSEKIKVKKVPKGGFYSMLVKLVKTHFL
jgi:hypothetical protein